VALAVAAVDLVAVVAAVDLVAAVAAVDLVAVAVAVVVGVEAPAGNQFLDPIAPIGTNKCRVRRWCREQADG